MPDGSTRAFIGGTSRFTLLDTLGGSNSLGQDINNNGQVTGDAQMPDGSYQAFIGDAGGLTGLGTLGGTYSSGRAINDLGQVVGHANFATGDTTAFLWDPLEGMLDLNDLVVDLSDWAYLAYASSISDTGYITGYGVTNKGLRHAFLLTPVDHHTPVPEPATLALLGLALLLLGLVRHIKRR